MPDQATCLLCHARLRVLGTVANRRFRFTAELPPLPPRSEILACTACGHVQKIHDEATQPVLERLYANYNAGNFSPRVSQAVFTEVTVMSREDLVLANCAPVLRGCADLLDIGCGTGTFIRCAGAILPATRLHGFDVTDVHRPEILALPNVDQFFSGQLEDIQAQLFDCIVMWQSLEHVPDPARALDVVRSMLRKSGKLLIQVPDLDRMTFDLAVFEHYSHFTEPTLTGFVEGCGFRVLINGRDWIHNCITLLLEKVDAPRTKALPDPRSTDGARGYVDWLNATAQHFQRLVESWPGSFVVFGIGTASGWLHGQLTRKARAFIDEDPSRVGLLVDTIPTEHPRAIRSDDLVLLPLQPEMARTIATRLLREHRGLDPGKLMCALHQYP